MKRPYDADHACVSLSCSKCDEPAGAWCRQPSGALSPWQHMQRYALLAELDTHRVRWSPLDDFEPDVDEEGCSKAEALAGADRLEARETRWREGLS